MKSYHYGDVFTIASTEYEPIPMPIPPQEYGNCSFTILLWNQHKTATLYIKYGEMKIQLPPTTSIVLDFQPYDMLAKGIYARTSTEGQIIDLQVIITGMEIPVFVINPQTGEINPISSNNPILKKIYLLGFAKEEVEQ